MKKLIIVVAGILFLTEGNSRAQDWKECSGKEWNYDLRGIKILTVIYDGFNYEETVDICAYWKKWGGRVDIAGTSNEHHGERNNPATGKVHDEIPASLRTDVLLANADYKQYDLIYFPGGEGVQDFLQSSRNEIRKVIDDAVSEHKYVAAICHAPFLLSASEYLRGHQVTVQGSEYKPELIKSGATIVNKLFVSDGYFITGQWPYFETFAVSVAEKILYPEGGGPFETDRKMNGALNRFLDQRNVYYMKPGVISDDTIRLIVKHSINPVLPFEIMNNSYLKIIAVKDPAVKSLIIDQLVEAGQEKFKSENISPEALKRHWTVILNAPVVMFFYTSMAGLKTGDDVTTLTRISTALAGQSVAQMGAVAKELGFSVSVLGGPRSFIAEEGIGKVLNIPPGYSLINILGIGHPVETANPPVARPLVDYLIIK